jgi:hypothetical protein
MNWGKSATKKSVIRFYGTSGAFQESYCLCSQGGKSHRRTIWMKSFKNSTPRKTYEYREQAAMQEEAKEEPVEEPTEINQHLD